MEDHQLPPESAIDQYSPKGQSAEKTQLLLETALGLYSPAYPVSAVKEQTPEEVLESDPVKNSPIYQVSEGEVELPEEAFESDRVKNISDPDR